MKTDEQKKELLNKIKALAERGVGGEKESAQLMYQKLLKKYNIKETELDDEELIRYEFHYNSVYERRLIAQILFMITGSDEIYKPIDNRVHTINMEMTKLQYLECVSLIDFYVVHLHDTLVKATIAFINAEDLFNKDIEPPSDTDREPDYDVLAMMTGMHKHNHYTQIEDQHSMISSNDD